MRLGVFGLYVMDIAYRDHLATILLCKFHVEFVHALLLRNAIIANRKVQMVVIKNLVQAVHVFESERIPPRRHILPVTAKEIASNSNHAFLELVNRL